MRNFKLDVASIMKVCLGVIFCISASSKITHHIDFYNIVIGYRMIDPIWSMLVAIVLPSLELIIGICLLCNIAFKEIMVILIALNVVFVTAQCSVMIRGINVSCGCLGLTGDSVSFLTLTRTIALLIVSFVTLILISGQMSH